MTAPSPKDIFAVRNDTDEPVRLWVMCSGYRVWDVWIAPRGAVAAPTFPPAHMTLEAELLEHRSRVVYAAATAPRPSSSTVVATLERLSGAYLMKLGEGEPVRANGLRISNAGGASLDFVARYGDSPYAATGFVGPNSKVDLKYDELAIVVTLDGLSERRKLDVPHGRWSIGRLPGEAGPVLSAVDALPAGEADGDDAMRW
ncbi:MAG: hypothetical protein ACTHKH_14950 [Trinickia sp.]|jgi:hypothetical protein